MIHFSHLCTAAFLSVYLFCSCAHAQSDIKKVWVAREDNGCKPGVEYRIWLNKVNRLTGEMWLFTTDENGKEKERGKYPTEIKTSDSKQITFTYKAGDGNGHEFTIFFPNGLQDRQEQGLMEFGTATKRELKFERSDK